MQYGSITKSKKRSKKIYFTQTSEHYVFVRSLGMHIMLLSLVTLNGRCSQNKIISFKLWNKWRHFISKTPDTYFAYFCFLEYFWEIKRHSKCSLTTTFASALKKTVEKSLTNNSSNKNRLLLRFSAFWSWYK